MGRPLGANGRVVAAAVLARAVCSGPCPAQVVHSGPGKLKRGAYRPANVCQQILGLEEPEVVPAHGVAEGAGSEGGWGVVGGGWGFLCMEE